MAKSRRTKSTAFDTITLEGGLISSAMLGQIAERKATSQTEPDYGIPKGLTLRDETARYYRMAAALYQDFTASPSPSTEAATTFTEGLFRDILGFSDMERDKNDGGIALQSKKGRVPVVVVQPSDDLDRASAYLTGEGRRRSAASALQDWLNHHEEALWGFCTNGERLRLMRDNASLTRPAFVEVNLRQIFEGENFADFAAVWLLLHSTRFGAAGSPVTDCHLERWRDAGAKEGVVAREKLSLNVEMALLALGNGFVSHPDNASLRSRLANGELALPDFFGELLRLVYRMIFLLVAEDRALLHPPEADTSACKLYAEGYGLAALRERAVRRTAWDRHYDRWEGLLITFQGLAGGQPKLGIPALGGLFDNTIPNLEAARLSNKALMEAVYRLAWLKDDGNLVPVNWRDMETEELGSVYESLLELAPILVDQGRGFTFAKGDETKGNQRKTTGSYYTPDSLVQTLLDSALDPVLDRVESESSDKVQGLLGVTVIDPACGSGHFLLAAARRIATRVARSRTGGVASAADYRHALRDVVRSCIHGVDRNPMAMELTKVALWIETVEPGKPLGFLDANILCGDSLLGVFDLEVLHQGIPDAAYRRLSGDDKDACKYFDKRNKAERDGQGTFDFTGGRSSLPAAPPLAESLRAVRTLPEDSTDQIAEKKLRLAAAKAERQLWSWRQAADMYTAAFLLPKKDAPREPGMALVPTTDHLWRILSGGQVYGLLVGTVREVVDQARVFHWPLEFPDVMAQGGFGVVIGNPPWERIKIQEQEFFSSREPEIARTSKANERDQKIAKLGDAPVGSRERSIFEEFELAKRFAKASSIFCRDSARFPLTGKGDINTYALFAELFLQLVSKVGRAGVIVPTGIAFDDNNSNFFTHIIDSASLVALFSFYEIRRWFKDTDDRKPFCILTLGMASAAPEFAFDIRALSELNLRERRFSLSRQDIARINPNTRTAPVFRSRADASLTEKIYGHVPVLMDERPDGNGNPWDITFLRMFDMDTDSALFMTLTDLEGRGYNREAPLWSYTHDGMPAYLPLFEAKHLHHFDHRWNTFEGLAERPSSEMEKVDITYEVAPRYWVPETEVVERIKEKNWKQGWLLGWRDIVGSEGRTLIPCICPLAGVGHKFLLMLPAQPAEVIAVLYGCLCSMVCDYAAKQKTGGSSLGYFVMKQLPVPAPQSFSGDAFEFVVPRVLELTYTSLSLRSFATSLGYVGEPFQWNDLRRSRLKAELDAWYARAYGLTRDDLRYILDPTDVMGEDYPSETFRVLKNNEIKKYGEYRTRRLVLEAWDRLEAGTEASGAPYDTPSPRPAAIDPSSLADGAWAASSDSADAATAQLAALIKALPGPTPIAHVRLAALFALEPRYLTRRLTGSERATWLRLIGPAAHLPQGTNIASFAPRINANWQSAVTRLRGMGSIIEDASARTWAPGSPIHEFVTDTWPDGRAAFVLRVFESLSLNDTTSGLPAEDRAWVEAHAA